MLMQTSFKKLEKACWAEYQRIKKDYKKMIKENKSTLKITETLRTLQKELIIDQLEDDKKNLSSLILKELLKNKLKITILKQYYNNEIELINKQIEETKELYKKEITIL